MVYLLDANVIFRFLIGDDEKFLAQSTTYFQEIERGSLQVEILESVLMEAFFVLTKFYRIPKAEVIADLKVILALDGVINHDKVVFLEALTIVEAKSIDFVDALICAKSSLQGYETPSFDHDVKRC
jgi:predicted nucleic-acid-binding protein